MVTLIITVQKNMAGLKTAETLQQFPALDMKDIYSPVTIKYGCALLVRAVDFVPIHMPHPSTPQGT
jgi:hypothetical protein